MRTLPGTNDWFLFFEFVHIFMATICDGLFPNYELFWQMLSKDKHKLKLIDWIWTPFEWIFLNRNMIGSLWKCSIHSTTFIKKPLVVEQRKYFCWMNRKWSTLNFLSCFCYTITAIFSNRIGNFIINRIFSTKYSNKSIDTLMNVFYSCE